MIDSITPNHLTAVEKSRWSSRDEQQDTMSATPSLPAAFKIVRQLLQQGPRPFQEILRDGIAAVPSSSKSAATNAQAATSTAAVKGKGKKNGVAQSKSTNIKPSVVPSDHPFISAK